MTTPEKTWMEFLEEGISKEIANDKIICPFCYHEHYEDTETLYECEFTCDKCRSVMGLEVEEVLEVTATPLVDNRAKELKKE